MFMPSGEILRRPGSFVLLRGCERALRLRPEVKRLKLRGQTVERRLDFLHVRGVEIGRIGKLVAGKQLFVRRGDRLTLGAVAHEHRLVPHLEALVFGDCIYEHDSGDILRVGDGEVPGNGSAERMPTSTKGPRSPSLARASCNSIFIWSKVRGAGPGSLHA